MQQGFVLPSVAGIVARWVPPNERATVIAMYTTGNQLAIVAGNPFFAFLCEKKSFLGGWPNIFYSSGLAALTWGIAWVVLITDSPQEHRWIGEHETAYIEMKLSDQGLTHKKVSL